MRHVLEITPARERIATAWPDGPPDALGVGEGEFLVAPPRECEARLARVARGESPGRVGAFLLSAFQPLELAGRAFLDARLRTVVALLAVAGLGVGLFTGEAYYYGGIEYAVVKALDFLRFAFVALALLLCPVIAFVRWLERFERCRREACPSCRSTDAEVAWFTDDEAGWTCTCGAEWTGPVTHVSVVGGDQGPLRVRTTLSRNAVAAALNRFADRERPAPRPRLFGGRAMAAVALALLSAGGVAAAFVAAAQQQAAGLREENEERNRDARNSLDGRPSLEPSDLLAQHVAWTAARELGHVPSPHAPGGRDDAAHLVDPSARAEYWRLAAHLDAPILAALDGEQALPHLDLENAWVARDNDGIAVLTSAKRVVLSGAGRRAYVGQFCLRARLSPAAPTKENPYGISIVAIDAEPHSGWPSGDDLCRLCATERR